MATKLLDIPEYVELENEALAKGAEWWFDHINLDGKPKFTDPNYKDMEQTSDWLYRALSGDTFNINTVALDETKKNIFISILVKYWQNHPYGTKHEKLCECIVREWTDYGANHEPFGSALKAIGINNDDNTVLPLKTYMYIYAGCVKVEDQIIFSNPSAPEKLFNIWKQIGQSIELDEKYDTFTIKTTCGNMFLCDHPLLPSATIKDYLQNK